MPTRLGASEVALCSRAAEQQPDRLAQATKDFAIAEHLPALPPTSQERAEAAAVALHSRAAIRDMDAYQAGIIVRHRLQQLAPTAHGLPGARLAPGWACRVADAAFGPGPAVGADAEFQEVRAWIGDDALSDITGETSQTTKAG